MNAFEPLTAGLQANTPADPAAALALLRGTSMPELVGRQLEALILSGAIAPGGHLNEAVLAERLGVSRGPIREAFRVLEAQGLVRQARNRGVYVREIDAAEAADIYDVRAGLDALAGRLLAVRPGAAEALAPHVEAMRVALSDPDADTATVADRYHALNLEFHRALIALTGNATLLAMYDRLVKQIALARRRALALPEAQTRSVAEHAAIVAAIAAGDGEAAARALHEHAMGGKARMLAAALPPNTEETA